MALLADSYQKGIAAHSHSPSRASAPANTGNDITSVTYLDIAINAKGATGNMVSVTHRASEYVLTKVPTSPGIIPNPKIGDKARVFFVDDAANAVNPTGYAEYIYANAAGAQTGTPGWRLVTTA